jgi:hypothetical protein
MASRKKIGIPHQIQHIHELLKNEIIALREDIQKMKTRLEGKKRREASDIGIDNFIGAIERKETELDILIDRYKATSELIPDSPIVAGILQHINTLFSRVYKVNSIAADRTAEVAALATGNYVDPESIERILNRLAKMIAILVILRYYSSPSSILPDLKRILGAMVGSITTLLPHVSPAILALYGNDLIAFLNTRLSRGTRISLAEETNIMSAFERPSDIGTDLPSHEDELFRSGFGQGLIEEESESIRSISRTFPRKSEARSRSRSRSRDRSRGRGSRGGKRRKRTRKNKH